MTTIDSPLVRFMDRVDGVFIFVAQLLLAAMMLLTFVSVVGRSFLHKTVPDGLLISEMLMVGMVFLPLGYVQSVGAHIEVTVLSDLFSRRVQSLLISMGLVFGIVVFGLMAWLGWLNAYESWRTGGYGFSSVLYIPEWPVKMLIPLGLGWWCLRMLIQLVLPATRPAVAQTEVRQALDEVDMAADADRGDGARHRETRP
ncbi:TRAP transporter small permease [Alloalcanivorax mobilis]|uniref:TRAP transporter small permease n=1 Tax=Alloalcanivorax mobilis TaxID=2019569 RepID=UPI000C78C5C3|nr:TRAP transporter small permease [Alloalcanivorax mobilis]